MHSRFYILVACASCFAFASEMSFIFKLNSAASLLVSDKPTTLANPVILPTDSLHDREHNQSAQAISGDARRVMLSTSPVDDITQESADTSRIGLAAFILGVAFLV